MVVIKKDDSINRVHDAGHLNSNTDQSSNFWPLEPLATQVALENEKHKAAIDPLYPYAHAILDDETIKLTRFPTADQLLAFIRKFYGLKGLPNFFLQQMSLFFKGLICQVSALD